MAEDGGLRRVAGQALHMIRERILQELQYTRGSGQDSPGGAKNVDQYVGGEEKEKVHGDVICCEEIMENKASDVNKTTSSKPADIKCSEKGVSTGEKLVRVEERVLPGSVEVGVVGRWVSETLARLLQVVASSSPSASPGSSPPADEHILANALLDYSWQKLNTGHWKDVDLSWRWVFTWGSLALVGLLLLRLRVASDAHSASHTSAYLAAADVVRACDRGLLMGVPVDHNPLHSTAAALNTYARLARAGAAEDEGEDGASITRQDAASVTSPLPSVHCPPLDRFLLHYMTAGVPVKLLGIVDHWPALNLWNIPYLRQIAGARIVPVEVGARYTDLTWSQALMTLDDYLTTYVTHHTPSTPIGYLAQHQLLDQVPQLQDDILVPDYCHLGEDPPRLHAWLGPRGTVSPLHHDPDHNILVQVMGYKYIRLYGEEQSALVYPHADPLLANTSQADVEGPLEEWPLLQQAQYQDLVLGPGEALYIPPRCWHYVRSLSTSFSVSFWWT